MARWDGVLALLLHDCDTRRGCPDGSTKLRFPDYVTMAQGVGKVVSLTHRPPLPQEIILVIFSVRG